MARTLPIALAVSLAAPPAGALDWAGTLGAQLRVAPAYPGAAGYALKPRPSGRLTVAGRGHLDLRDRPQAAWDVWQPGRWRVAVSATVAPGRPPRLRARYDGLARRAPRPALGLALERRRGPLAAYARAHARLGGGALGELGAEFQTRLGLAPWVVGVDGGLALATGAALAPRWGLDAATADLAAYDPGAGLAAGTLRVTAVRLLGADWAWAARGRVTGLGPPAADSPVVRRRWQAGLSLAVLRRF